MSEITEIVNKSIKSKLPLHEQSLRVAAYCRVSTTYEEQKSSLSAQIAYYKRLVETDPNWVLVNIYAEAVTGVDIKRRLRFRQMLEDCRFNDAKNEMSLHQQKAKIALLKLPKKWGLHNCKY